ncbi:MAG TPA: hypothetical protein VGF70_15725 [Solirubrobacteraceae bacterium]|jgi:hypothetical protein
MPEPDRRRGLRRPRFSLLLSALVGVAALAIVLAGGGGARSGPPPSQRQPTGSGDRQRACVTTEAQARDIARAVVTATGRATIPEQVSETAIGPRAAVTVTRGGRFTAQVTASRHIAVTEHAVGRARHCAVAGSPTAARGLALRQAYAVARIRARKQAAGGAARGLQTLKHRVFPLVQTAARSAALRRARSQALAARPALIHAARRLARRRAGAA